MDIRPLSAEAKKNPDPLEIDLKNGPHKDVHRTTCCWLVDRWDTFKHSE